MPHPDMIETAPARASRRKPPATPGKHEPRPILGKRAVRGMHRLLAEMTPGTYLHDPELTAAVRWLTNYVAWHESPAIVARRKVRGESIKSWSTKQAAS